MMFAARPEIRPTTIQVFVAGQPVLVPEGASAAAAILLAGIPASRHTPVSGAPRLPYCMMGACFDCLAAIDGTPNRQACMTQAVDGMRVEPQIGARPIPTGPTP
jgi:predicted molibdopterin-dependent oxidoreductase YjgC